MSYSISLSIDTGAGNFAEVYCTNYTYNVSPMLRLMNPPNGIYGLNGLVAGEAASLLGEMILYGEAHQEELKALNPENGWGSYEGMLSWLKSMRAACETHPACTVTVT